MELKAWHFIGKDRQLGYGHGETVEPGYIYSVQGDLELCGWGMHASVRAIDALRYAPGPVVCRVKMGGDIIKDNDKVVAHTREVMWMTDATNCLHEFACVVAEDALRRAGVKDPCCWAAIAAKRKWVKGEIGDAELDAARAAARAAALDATWDATRAATRAATRVTWAAVWDAARAAAWVAARVAALDAAWAEQNKILSEMLEKLERET